MSPTRFHPRNGYRRFQAGTLVIAFFATASLRAEPADPVEELREALKADASATAKDALDFRKKALEEKAAKIRSLAELGRALLLHEWRADRQSLQQEPAPVNGIDATVRNAMAGRLRAEIAAGFASEDPARQLATAAFVGELASTANLSAFPSEIFVYRTLGDLAPALAKLTEAKDPAVASAAARALGRIPRDRKVTVAALERLLAAEDASARRAAAAGLRQMISTADAQWHWRGRDEPAPPTGDDVVGAAGAGLISTDAEVRRLCLQAIRDAARSTSERIRHPFDRHEFPPPGRPLTPAEADFLESQRGHVKAEQEQIQPVMVAFEKRAAAVIRLVGDADPLVSAAAGEALEAIGDTRRRLGDLLASVPDPNRKPGRGDDALGDALRPAVKELAKRLSDKKEVRLQLAALYALESLSDLASPVASEVVNALKDDNPYVRWGAVRVLGRIAPAQAEQAVPALAPLLNDKNEYVRSTTGLVLARYGPTAKGAVMELAAAAGDGEARFRVQAIQALAAIGPDAEPAAGALGKALAQEDPEVRVAAAKALVKLGPGAGKAAEALRKALDDADPAVRFAASEALLNVK
jgi:HEAT repeat protein